MIDISEKDFLNYLEKYANKEISMSKLVEVLKSDYRTINNKIIEISITNPELYYRIVLGHPYKQKGRVDIDFEALMIYIIKHSITIMQASEIFNVSRRTIQRRVNEIKSTNLELYKLFKIAVGKDKRILNSLDIQEQIGKLQSRPVVVGEVNEEREKFLLDIEKRYNELLATGILKEQAAKEMGYTRNYINNALDELYRIKIEKSVKANKPNIFKNNLSDMTQYINQTIDRKELSDSKKVEKDEGR